MIAVALANAVGATMTESNRNAALVWVRESAHIATPARWPGKYDQYRRPVSSKESIALRRWVSSRVSMKSVAAVTSRSTALTATA